ncbi:hypothetical protein IB229_14095 [Pseudomonas sp. PDM14]|uniref:hypothetical protein n=1 Tax=Pseudomonas sp. PDM14 TaxID=2769288 RepID=UPI001786B64A|nr:hypothetical protein [Pseudomonas sp. PDM14]MBD9484111.1 hypothetical protein [Pseudomonas sp. PDM14]
MSRVPLRAREIEQALQACMHPVQVRCVREEDGTLTVHLELSGQQLVVIGVKKDDLYDEASVHILGQALLAEVRAVFSMNSPGLNR